LVRVFGKNRIIIKGHYRFCYLFLMAGVVPLFSAIRPPLFPRKRLWARHWEEQGQFAVSRFSRQNAKKTVKHNGQKRKEGAAQKEERVYGPFFILGENRGPTRRKNRRKLQCPFYQGNGEPPSQRCHTDENVALGIDELDNFLGGLVSIFQVRELCLSRVIGSG